MSNTIKLNLESIARSMTFSVLIFCFFQACAYIPESEQLISAVQDKPPIRSNGDCIQNSLSLKQTSVTGVGLSPDSITIFDWNIYKEQKKGWQRDLIRFSRATDIILLQEASLSDELLHILDQENLNWTFNSAFSFKNVESGVLTASTIQPLGSCGLRTIEPVIGVPKTTLISRYRLTGSPDELLVGNIHGINISLGVGSYQEQIGELYSILSQHDGPIILAGDFNNWNRDRTSVITELMAQLSLQALTFDDEIRTTFFGAPVDHILYRGLKPVAYEIYQVSSSDHNPIKATFQHTQTLVVRDTI